MNITFVSNFNTTGTPTINIYKVLNGADTLVESGTMTAGIETGMYLYNYTTANPNFDYVARMALGAEKQNGEWQGILSQIFNKPTSGGGGGTTTQKLTEEQLKELVKEMTKLFQTSLSGIEIELPEDLGKKEIENAISEIKEKGKENLDKLIKSYEEVLEQEKQAQNKRFEGFKKESGINTQKIEETLEKYQKMTNKANESILGEIERSIEASGGKFVEIAKLFSAFRKEKKEEAVNFAKLIGAFRNELKK